VLERALAKASRDASSRAAYSVADGIVTIGSAETLSRYTVPHPYNLTDLVMMLDTPIYNDVPDMDLAHLLMPDKSNRGESPFNGGGRKIAKNERMDHDEKMHRLVTMIENTVDPDSWRDRGGSTGSIQELNGNLIISTTPANHREITGLLSKLRELKSMQINVESRFLVVSQDFFEQIGFDIDMYFNAGSNQVRAARANDPTILPGDFFDFRKPFGFNGTQVQGPIMRNITGQQSSAGVVPPAGADATRVAQGIVPPNRLSPVGVGRTASAWRKAWRAGSAPLPRASSTRRRHWALRGSSLMTCRLTSW